MKIVIALPKLTPGGAERTATVLANYLVEKGDDVTLLLMYRKERFYEVDVRVKVIEPPDVQQRIGKLLYLFFIVYYLHRQIRKIQPDVVFAIGYMLLTIVASIGISTKVILSGRSSPSRVRFPNNRLLNAFYFQLHALLRFRVEGIVAQTQRAQEAFKKRYPNKRIEVIPNFLRPLQAVEVTPQNQIITVGRCEKEKGHDYLLRAFSKLQAPSWKLIILGDGSQRKNLEELANELGVTQRVIFAGFQKEVDTYLAQSKIFAFTSLHEGFPNALLEAIATPLACVSFDCDAGPSDIIQHEENGILVKLKDTEELARQLQLLIDNESYRNRLAEKAFQCRQVYALPVVADRYRNFFIKMLSV